MNTRAIHGLSMFELRWQAFSLFAICALAVSVSLGSALVGLSKVLVLLAVVGRARLDGWSGFKTWFRQAPAPVWIILCALCWVGLSGLWTVADMPEARAAFFRHARLIWLVAVLYLIRRPVQAWTVLTWLAVGQAAVVLLSWLMWAGLPIPFATADTPPEMGILFTSTLEQPVMGALLVALLWWFRGRWARMGPALWCPVLIFLTTANIFLVMSGRTGYLVMLALAVLAFWRASPRKVRVLAALIPLAVAIGLFQWWPRFHDRVMAVQQNVARYQQGAVDTSQAIRLEMWRVAVEAARDKPWLGHGVGSYPTLYKHYEGRDPKGASNPHQQYLFWLAEFGLPGLGFLLAFLIALLRHARRLPEDASGALASAVMIASVMSLANCPFYGVGMGEFLLLMMAALMAMQAAGAGGSVVSQEVMA